VVCSDRRAPGADERLAELYRRHARAIYRYLFGLTRGDHRESEDCLQDTFVRAWHHLQKRPDDLDRMRPWLFKVARHIVIDELRARRARPATVDVADLAALSTSDNAIERLVTSHAVRRALGEVSPEHRDVIVEIYLHGRTAKETAASFGIPEGTVKSRLHYGLSAMRLKAAQFELA
jgi:RNA polymerase sigma-70 factor, ECF subfamily